MSYVIFHDIERDVTVKAPLDGATPKLSGGFGGWEEQQRPKELGYTVWRGQSLLHQSFSVLFDGWRKKESVQRDVNVLTVMALPTIGGPPPRVKITTPVALTTGYINGLYWVIDDLDWGDALRDENGTLLRQQVTVSLTQHADADIVVKSKATKAKTRRTYTVKAGDTLISIAKKVLGSAKRWRELAELNNIRDPRASKKLRTGKRLKLP